MKQNIRLKPYFIYFALIKKTQKKQQKQTIAQSAMKTLSCHTCFCAWIEQIIEGVVKSYCAHFQLQYFLFHDYYNSLKEFTAILPLS